MNSPALSIDHTLLKPQATEDDIRRLCEEAVEYAFVSVCIPPRYVGLAARCLYGSGVSVGTVIGFPLGYTTTAAKVAETEEALEKGAAEVDMVIPLGPALGGDLAAVGEDVAAVVNAASTARVKVILECCYLGEGQKRALTELVATSGAAYVKTSTGFGAGGATREDVTLLAEVAAGRIGVKAAGGIRDWEACKGFLQAGATRIGTSAGVAILEGWRREAGI